MGVLPYFRLLRPKSWVKNLLVFAALLFAGRLRDPSSWLASGAVFAAFCFLASSFYVLNDWMDQEEDKRHPVKKNRPIASGAVGGVGATVLVISLVCGIYVMIVLLPVKRQIPTTLVLGSYAVLQMGYNSGLKHVFGLDLFIVAGGYVLRAIAGGVGIGVPVTDWFMLSIFLLCLMLIAGKRRAELRSLKGVEAEQHRPILSIYSENLMDQIISLSGTAALVTYSLWAIQGNEGSNISQAGLPFSVLFVVFGLIRYFFLVFEEDLGGEPEQLFITDRPLQICVGGWIAYILVLAWLR